MKKATTLIIIAMLLAVGLPQAKAQLSGTYIIPSPWPATLASFMDSLNKVGVSGAVTVNLNQDERAPAGGYILGSKELNSGPNQLTLARPLVINGNNHTLTAAAGTGSTDGIFKIQGADFVTINNLHLKEDTANITATTKMEWGYAVVKRNRNDGVKTLTIQRCKVSLDNKNTTAASGVSGYGASGIFIGNCLATSAAPLPVPTVDSGSHDGIFISQDTITNVNSGVFQYGTAMVIDGVGYNDNAVTIMNNQISNFTQWGVYLLFSNNDLVSGNRLNNMSDGGTAPTAGNGITGIIYDGNLYTATHNSWRCENNFVDLTVAGAFAAGIQTMIKGNGTTVIAGDTIKLTASGPTDMLIGIWGGNDAGSQTISGNLIRDFSTSPANVGIVAGIWSGQAFRTPSGYPAVSEIRNNIVRNFNIKSGSFIIGCVDMNLVSTNPSVFTGNVLTNLVVTDTAAALKGYLFRNTVNTGSVNLTASDNVFSDFNVSGTRIPVTVMDPVANITVSGDLSGNTFRNIRAGTGFITGIQLDKSRSMKMDRDTFINLQGGADVYAYKAGYDDTGVTTISISRNLIDSLASDGESATVAAIGITPGRSNPVTAVTVNNNRISRLYAGGAKANAYGMNVVSGLAAYNIYNNILSDIVASADTAAYSSSFGFNLQSSGLNNIYYNTVNLYTGTVPRTGFGATGIAYNPSGTNTLRNNIFRVNVIAGAKNSVTAVRATAGYALAAPATSGFSSSNNIYYSPAGPNNFLYVEGTAHSDLVNGFHQNGLAQNTAQNILNDTFFNSDCDRSSYHRFMQVASLSRETGTYFENNLTGTAGLYVPAGTTYAEAGAKDIPAVSNDFGAKLRPAGSADIGAVEFNGTPVPDMKVTLSSGTGRDTACIYRLPRLHVSVPAFFGRVSYQWYRDTVMIPGAAGTSITAAGASAVYKVEVYDSVGGCSYMSRDLTMTIVPPPPAVITYYESLVFCESSAVVLSGNKGSGYLYQWYRDGSPLPGEVKDHYTASTGGRYSLQLNTALECPVMSDEVKVTVYPLPSPTIYLSGPWLMTQKYMSYQWYHDKVKIPAPDGQAPQYIPAEDGAYYVEVTDSNGCTARSAIHIATTGIESFGSADLIRVFPNPSSGTVQIESPLPLSASLYDLGGRLMLQQSAVERLDLGAYAEGVYLLQLRTAEGVLVRNVKLVRNK